MDSLSETRAAPPSIVHRTWRTRAFWRRLPLRVVVFPVLVRGRTQCVPSVATRIVAKIYRSLFSLMSVLYLVSK